MARKKTAATEPSEPRHPTSLRVPRAEAADKIQKRIDEGEALLTIPIKSEAQLEQLSEKNKEWSDYNEELLRRLFDTDELSAEYIAGYGFAFSMRPTFAQKIGYVHRSIKESLSRLRSIYRRLELYPELPDLQARSRSVEAKTIVERGSDIFVVHGRDDAPKEAVARFLEKLELTAIILHERPDRGRTIIEKFENYADVGFAVVIMTPDDVGASVSQLEELKELEKKLKALQPRARQNVLLELGYFLGKLGRARVCTLYTEGVEIPSDFAGVLYIPLDPDGAWRLRLAREIQAAGIDIDLNRAL